jgi:hypothetical protein
VRVKVAPAFIFERDIPPRMVAQREEALEEMNADIKIWELAGLVVDTEPWTPNYQDKETSSFLTLGIFSVNKYGPNHTEYDRVGDAVIRMAVVDGGSKYLVWGETYDGTNRYTIGDYARLGDALESLREKVKGWM